MRDPFETFLSYFEDIEKTGSGYLVYCPGHDDKNRKSLHVSRGDKVPVVLRCFTGCNNETILAAMGLSMRDLFDEEEELKLRASYGGRFTQLYSASASSGDRISAAELQLDAELELRPKDKFFGIGNADERFLGRLDPASQNHHRKSNYHD